MKIKQYLRESSVGTVGFFISPKGEIILAEITHINTVLKFAEKFGLKKDDIIELYDKFGEKVGTEGKAREQIMQGLLKKGWTWMRKYPNKMWSVVVNRVDKKFKDRVYSWAKKILDGIHGYREEDKYMPVAITEFSTGKVIRHSVDEISKDILYNIDESKKGKSRYTIIEVVWTKETYEE